MNKKPKVAVLLGSQSDIPAMEGCIELLREFGLEADLKIMSAHRQPDQVAEFADGAVEAGYEVIIASAGLAAALPGAVAARTILPVIGVPIPSAAAFHGLDALLAMVQMPSGVPVATVTVGKPGGANAAVLASQILALKYPEVNTRLQAYKCSLAE
jgi:5-(carboxyamino)imidazole ribonucleotide mutase